MGEFPSCPQAIILSLYSPQPIFCLWHHLGITSPFLRMVTMFLVSDSQQLGGAGWRHGPWAGCPNKPLFRALPIYPDRVLSPHHQTSSEKNQQPNSQIEPEEDLPAETRGQSQGQSGGCRSTSGRQRPPEDQAPGLSVDVTPFKGPASCQPLVASATSLEAWGETAHLRGRWACRHLPKGMTWSLHMAILFLLHVSGESLMASSAPLR